MTTAVVLGAAGFVGRHVTEALLEGTPGEVAGAGRGPAPAWFAGRWVQLDLSTIDPAGLASRLDALGASLVVNCVGSAAGTGASLIEANVFTTERLVAALEILGPRVRLVHIGSAAEYGPGTVGIPVGEDAAARPAGPYGAAKLAATQIVTGAADDGRIEATVLRLFNPIGAGMSEVSLAGAARSRLLAAIATGAGSIAMGPLSSVRDFVDVRDAASSVAAVAAAAGPPPRIVNVGSGVGRTARELVTALAARLGFDGLIEERSDGSPRSSDVPWQVADIGLARRVLGWEPRRDLGSSVEAIVAGPSGPGVAGQPAPELDV